MTILTPRDLMNSMSASITSSGRRKDGISHTVPPGRSRASNTVTSTPFRARKYAAESPAGPEPITATLGGDG